MSHVTITTWVATSRCVFCFQTYNHGKKINGQLRKTALSLTPQAMYNQFKRQSAESLRELYYIYRKT